MLSLLKTEWLKIKNYRTFWILLLLYIFCIFAINYIAHFFIGKILSDRGSKGMAELIVGISPFSFPDVWKTVSYMSSFLLILPGLLIIILTTNEYSFKTHRQNIIDGWSRKQFIHIKIVLCILLAVISTFFTSITALGFGLSKTAAFNFNGFHYIGYFFLQALSYNFFALFLAVLIKRGGLAIGVYFIYAAILETLFAGVLSHFFRNSGRYLPLEASDNLIPPPVLENVQKTISSVPDYNTLLIASCIYLMIFYAFSRLRFERDDL